MRSTVLLILAAVLLASPAAAQPGTAAAAQDTRIVVTYTVTGRLGAAPEPGSVPVELLEILSREQRLALFRVGEGDGALADYVEAVFVFTSGDSFRTWYASDQGRAVVEALTTRLHDSRSRLTYLRPGLHAQIPE